VEKVWSGCRAVAQPIGCLEREIRGGHKRNPPMTSAPNFTIHGTAALLAYKEAKYSEYVA
jgi:hypothetical protein